MIDLVGIPTRILVPSTAVPVHVGFDTCLTAVHVVREYRYQHLSQNLSEISWKSLHFLLVIANENRSIGHRPVPQELPANYVPLAIAIG